MLSLFRTRQAFSLIEVVVAVAIFSTAIIAILGLMGSLTQSTREVLDSAVAARLADVVDRELKSGLTFAQLTAATADPENPLILYATQDGARVVLHENRGNDPDPTIGNPPGLVPRDRYFVLFVAQLDEPQSSPDYNFAALVIRAEWPYLQDQNPPSSDVARTGFAYHSAFLP